jgi:nucleotide-binding universal stress UspA family protein
MFHDIVVPLDGSSFAERALGLAEWIASECGARIHLIRVHLLPAGRPTDQDAAVRAADERYLQSFASRLRDSLNDVCVSVLDGSAALAIADYADRVSADLIVMTTHGRTGDERRRLGSVAAVVVHHARCPVLLVRPSEAGGGAPHVSFEHVLIAVDGTEQREDVESMALRLGTLGHPAFRIVHPLVPAQVPQLVSVGPNTDVRIDGCARPEHTGAEGYVSCIARRLRAAGLRADVLVAVTEWPAHAILAAAEREAADLIVLATRLDAASRIFPPGMVEALLHESSSPLLLIRERE